MSEGHRYTLMCSEPWKNLSSGSKSLKYDISAEWKGKLIFFTFVKMSGVYYKVSTVIKLTWEQLVKTREWYSSTVFQSGGSSVEEKDPSNQAVAWAILKWLFLTNKLPTCPRDPLLQLKELGIPLLNTKPQIKQGRTSHSILTLNQKTQSREIPIWCPFLAFFGMTYCSAAYSAALILKQAVNISVN